MSDESSHSAGTGVRDDGYDDLLDAVEDGSGYYLECANGHGSVPPRRVCPDCGTDDLTETPLPESGEIETYTVTHVATPSFSEDTPYVTAIARFGAVRVTGQIRNIDPDNVEEGLPVELTTARSEAGTERFLGFRPR
ncbi:Zn-ribbon domain-containing OB-fold protein [Halostella sp. PRR32]|uniref:Zn-ribbon domain-containing OB-fold protein n=1 Tax=Halostella sp. PRR32 TaxID=3098147 RepID=UPI00110E52BA|nr:Zn-ribbon domain-containing OB-fold protein [Halostella sp. PRR32]